VWGSPRGETHRLRERIVLVSSDKNQGGTAVLFSGGLDSAVLLAEALRIERGVVQPLYVSTGLAWERDELSAIARLLEAEAYRDVPPLVHLRFDVSDIYPSTHWAIRGEAPAFDTPDEDVYLEGRNIALLSKASIFMARAGLTRILIGPLAGNPFPDATPAFFDQFGRALSAGLARPIAIAAPFLTRHKADVIALGAELGVPLERTLSCMQPIDGGHCGQCSKCRERRDAFRDAGIADPTNYSRQPAR
jgi:7-cyano-7-deazaguanine synthase